MTNHTTNPRLSSSLAVTTIMVLHNSSYIAVMFAIFHNYTVLSSSIGYMTLLCYD